MFSGHWSLIFGSRINHLFHSFGARSVSFINSSWCPMCGPRNNPLFTEGINWLGTGIRTGLCGLPSGTASPALGRQRQMQAPDLHREYSRGYVGETISKEEKEKETSELFLGAQTFLLYSDLRFSGYVFGYFAYFFCFQGICFRSILVSDWFVFSFAFLKSLKVFWVLFWFVLILLALGTCGLLPTWPLPLDTRSVPRWTLFWGSSCILQPCYF